MKNPSDEIHDSDSLRNWLHANPQGLLINVLPEDAFDEARIPNSKNACVYEMAFLKTMEHLAPDQSTALVVYGESAKTLEADVAFEKLRQAGYSNAKVFRGGLVAWSEAGLPLEGLGVSIAPVDGNYHLDTSSSVIRWMGRNLFNHHEGTLRLTAGSARVKCGNFEGADFTINMNTIACSDISDSQMNGMLVSHLRSDDFFSVDQFPSASFTTLSLTPITEATLGSANWMITGALTLRGVTADVTFPAVIAMKPEGILVAQAEFSIDRTRWGAVYGSGKFFARLAHHVVNDDVHLHLKLYLLPPN